MPTEKPKTPRPKTEVVEEQIEVTPPQVIEQVTLREALLQSAEPALEEKPVVIEENAPIVIARRPMPKILKEKQVVRPVKITATQEQKPKITVEKPKSAAITEEPLAAEHELLVEEEFFETETVIPSQEFENVTSDPQPEFSEKSVLIDQTTQEKPNIQLLQLELSFLMFEAEQTDEPLVLAVEQVPPIVGQLTEHIATLEPPAAEESTAILGIMVEKISLLDEVTETSVDPEQLEQELEILCDRLLICLGVEPTPELVKQFVLLLKEDHIKQQARSGANQAMDEGTHERKQLNALADDYQTTPTFWSGLGKCALRFIHKDYANQLA